MTGTDWITPGAQVLLFNTGGTGASRNAVEATIARVATKSFTVDREREPRFPIARPEVHEGGSWGWTRHCVPLDSDQARSVLAEAKRQAVKNRAHGAVDAWLRDRDNRDLCATAIDALTRHLGELDVPARAPRSS